MINNRPTTPPKRSTTCGLCITDALNAQSGLNVVDNALWVSPSGWARQWFTDDGSWWLHLPGHRHGCGIDPRSAILVRHPEAADRHPPDTQA